MSTAPPDLVRAAQERAAALGFTASCEPTVGRLLATLAAAVPRAGRVLELGTGSGVGTAWLVSGISPRTDVTLTTVENDPRLADAVRSAQPPCWVHVVTGDALAVLPALGEFDLVFADAVAGKWHGLDVTVTALRPGGILVVDDMQLDRYREPEHRETVAAVRRALVDDPRMVVADFVEAAGVLLATRRSA